MSNISIEEIEDQIRILEETSVMGESDAFALKALRWLLAFEKASKEPVAIVELNDNLTVAEIRGDIPRRKAVCELYEGALVIGQKLYATPQPESETNFPVGWIKCCEQVPEEFGRYWCYVEEQNSLGKSHYQWNCSWNGDVWSDAALSGSVTHWMPLAAAPKP